MAEKWFTVLLSSDVYGVDDFEYDNLAEAVEGVGRLARSCFTQSRKDGIDRRLTLLISGMDEAIDEELDTSA